MHHVGNLTFNVCKLTHGLSGDNHHPGNLGQMCYRFDQLKVLTGDSRLQYLRPFGQTMSLTVTWVVSASQNKKGANDDYQYEQAAQTWVG